jgi:hypothetical protein
MNTISNSGLRGVSDTLSGALWSLDAALEVAATGATGVNFHCERRGQLQCGGEMAAPQQPAGASLSCCTGPGP